MLSPITFYRRYDVLVLLCIIVLVYHVAYFLPASHSYTIPHIRHTVCHIGHNRHVKQDLSAMNATLGVR